MKPPASVTASLMSDTKWRKFFLVLARYEKQLYAGVWKLVGESEPIVGNLPRTLDVHETAVDGCLNGPVSYSAIEWLEIPRELKSRRYQGAVELTKHQDTAEFERALSELGEFPLTTGTQGLRIEGWHVPQANNSLQADRER